MSTIEAASNPPTLVRNRNRYDMKLEVVTIPVSDVDRAKQFYGSLGWRLDADINKGSAFRAVQFTPPGSECSIHFRKGTAPPASGPVKNLYLVVSNIEVARKDLIERGVAVGEIFHLFPGEEPGIGIDPKRGSYRSYASFSDPDGNGWLLQEITARLPGRVERADAVFSSSAELAIALRRAEVAHGQRERLSGLHDANWSEWYAEYLVREQTGRLMPP